MSRKATLLLLLMVLAASSQTPEEMLSAVAAPAAQTPTPNLPRDRVILTAEAYRRCRWYCADNNMGPCAGYTNDQFSAGQVYEGMAYWLSGWDSLAGFETHLSEGRMAGCRWDSCYGAACAAGIDCSGFVSRCWEQTRKYYTYDLPDISTSYNSQDYGVLRDSMQAGDIFNHPSGDTHAHVMLLYAFDSDDNPIYYESTGIGWPYRVWLNRGSGWSRIRSWGTNWSARYYNNIITDTQTFLPYVVAGYYGDVNTHIRIYNARASDINVTVQFYDSDGSAVGTANVAVPVLGVTEVNAATYVPPNYYGQALSAVVYASEPLVITAQLVDDDPYQASGYAGLVNGSDQIFFSLLKKDYGGASSKVTIQNIGRDAARVNIVYYPVNGKGIWAEKGVTIAPHGAHTFGLASLPANFIGSAVVRCIDNGQIVGAFCEQGSGSFLVDVGVDSENTKDWAYLPAVKWRYTSDASAQATAARSTTQPLVPRVYLPIVMSYYPSTSSIIQVQNAGARDTVVVATYYRVDGSGPWSEQHFVKAGYACTLAPPVPDNWIGSVVIESQTIVAPLAVTVNEAGPTMYTNYTGFDRGTIQLYAPTLYYTNERISSIQVQNVDSEPVSVYVFYYHNNGTIPEFQSSTIAPNQTHTFHQKTLPFPFWGTASIEVQNGKKIVATVNVARNGTSGDQAWSYSLPVPFPNMYPVIE